MLDHVCIYTLAYLSNPYSNYPKNSNQRNHKSLYYSLDISFPPHTTMQLVKILSLFLFAVAAVEATDNAPSGDINPTATVGPGDKRWLRRSIPKREEVPQ